MGALALLQVFGPILANLIPQIATIFKPTGEVAQRNVALAETLVSTITKAADAPNLQAAVEKMQAEPEVAKTVQKAVVTEPTIMETLQVTEFGGGVVKAAERGLEIQQADKPFWYNPVVWITAALIPMMYLIAAQVLFTFAGPVLTGNGSPDGILLPTPWYAQIGFDPNTRTGLINLIVGFVFGGICGIWFGTTVAKQRSDAVPQAAGTNGKTT